MQLHASTAQAIANLSTAQGQIVKNTGNETIAGVKTFQNEIISNSSITAGQDSGSVSLTVNDGLGNANVTFNHKYGIPDIEGGSSARITATVDGPTAKMEFQLKSNTEKGISQALTTVMTLMEDSVTVHKPLIVPTPTTNTQVANKAYVDSKAGGAAFVANDARVKTALNATGNAPIYACRAWVNFNGTWTVAIRASGNVSSITDNGPGNYTLNFISAMPDANFKTDCTHNVFGPGAPFGCIVNEYNNRTISSVNVQTIYNNTVADVSDINVSIFR